MNAFITFFRSTFFGPYPYFWEEKQLRSASGSPRIFYYLWVTPKRFADPILVTSNNSNKDFKEIKERWIEELSK